MDSILTSIKKLLGIPETNTYFDPDITMHINTVFMSVTELGAGPAEGFFIVDASNTWSEFFGDAKVIHAVTSYTYLKVRLLFEANALSSAVIESINRQAAELEWRIKELVENPAFNEEEV